LLEHQRHRPCPGSPGAGQLSTGHFGAFWLGQAARGARSVTRRVGGPTMETDRPCCPSLGSIGARSEAIPEDSDCIGPSSTHRGLAQRATPSQLTRLLQSRRMGSFPPQRRPSGGIINRSNLSAEPDQAHFTQGGFRSAVSLFPC